MALSREFQMSQPPIFIASLFIKVLAWILLIAVAVLVGIILIYGHITTLDMYGTINSAVKVAYIVHLWIYYGRGEEKDE